MPSEAARCAWQVFAGIIPGVSIPGYTRTRGITSGQWEEITNRPDMTPDHPDNLFTRYQREAHEYGVSITNPSAINWVRVEFIWF